ncbi:hypothetical protein GCM10023185_29700 [Hymenobacter saemangeumensis]|uniref:Uncharacterized protein n=1 Tax=Hymenobacter saemangeumensis TaxID=1084522 RepID=A0ABP8ILJ2_9BACT
MSSTNQIFVQGVPLDLDEETQLVPTFQANDRSKTDSIQSDYSPEFSVPGTQRNHRLLGVGGSAQATAGTPYRRLPAVLLSNNVETLPLALLYVKSFQGGRYYLQLVGGNRRFIETLGEKKLADLDLSEFDHDWTPATIAAGLPFAHWQQHGWGYEVIERGKDLNLGEVDPYHLFPSVALRLVWGRMLEEAGFTATDLTTEPLFAALNIPTAAPYTFPGPYRDARTLAAGWRYQDGQMFRRRSEFGPLTFPFNFTTEHPYSAPTAATFSNGEYTVSTLGYYDLTASLDVVISCASGYPGEVSMKVALHVNGSEVGTVGYIRAGNYTRTTLTASVTRLLLRPGDEVHVIIQGDEWPNQFGLGPRESFWQVGTSRPFFVRSDGVIIEFGPAYNPNLYRIDAANRFGVTLLEEFPQGGRVMLNLWLPDMTQLDFFKSVVQLLGLTVQTDLYEPHLYLSTGGRVLANTERAIDWTAKRDAAAAPQGLPDRSTAYRFGDFAQRNYLRWLEDEAVSEGYGDGMLVVEDETLPEEGTLAVLPYAATEPSPTVPSLLRIRSYRRRDPNPAVAAEYDTMSPKPRLVLRVERPTFTVQIVMVPRRIAGSTVDGVFYPVDVPAVLQEVVTTASYFAAPSAPFDLSAERTLLPRFWPDLAATLKEARHLTEYYRLTPQDIAELDFAVPIWDGGLGDFFLVSQVGEYDPKRSVEVVLMRLHPTLIPPPALGQGFEFYLPEFEGTEFF